MPATLECLHRWRLHVNLSGGGGGWWSWWLPMLLVARMVLVVPAGAADSSISWPLAFSRFRFYAAQWISVALNDISGTDTGHGPFSVTIATPCQRPHPPAAQPMLLGTFINASHSKSPVAETRRLGSPSIFAEKCNSARFAF
ncbi:GM13225 [Drosophila sechellia]|uniref:GM13225 n=1 Tax=Drosophila sechellia TaxID=7238 RepID=B4ILB4_DROSE|nr:GM13225 [Drosophila sechellia]